jgi:hypothetical protein
MSTVKIDLTDLFVGTGPPYGDYLEGPRKLTGKPEPYGVELSGAHTIDQSHELVLKKKPNPNATNP